MSKQPKAAKFDAEDYRQQDDARSMMQAHEVMSDPTRHANAVKHLTKMHKDKKKESMHAKAAKGLKAAFPPDQNNPAASTTGNSNSTITKINRVPNLQDANQGPEGEED